MGRRPVSQPVPGVALPPITPAEQAAVETRVVRQGGNPHAAALGELANGGTALEVAGAQDPRERDQPHPEGFRLNAAAGWRKQHLENADDGFRKLGVILSAGGVFVQALVKLLPIEVLIGGVNRVAILRPQIFSELVLHVVTP